MLICSDTGDIILQSSAVLKQNLLAVQALWVNSVLDLNVENLKTFTLEGPAVDYHLFKCGPILNDEVKGFEIKLSVRYASFKVGYEHFLSRFENTEMECSSIEWNTVASKSEVKLVRFDDISLKEANPSSYFTVQPRKTMHLS
jgi:hypothetical protein